MPTFCCYGVSTNGQIPLIVLLKNWNYWNSNEQKIFWKDSHAHMFSAICIWLLSTFYEASWIKRIVGCLGKYLAGACRIRANRLPSVKKSEKRRIKLKHRCHAIGKVCSFNLTREARGSSLSDENYTRKLFNQLATFAELVQYSFDFSPFKTQTHRLYPFILNLNNHSSIYNGLWSLENQIK